MKLTTALVLVLVLAILAGLYLDNRGALKQYQNAQLAELSRKQAESRRILAVNLEALGETDIDQSTLNGWVELVYLAKKE